MLTMYAILAVPFLLAVLGSLLMSAITYIQNMFRTRGFKPKLHYRESALTRHLLSKCRLRERTFSPSIWLRNPHVQTLVSVIKPTCDVSFEREYLQMRDKGVVALDWVVTYQPKMKRKRTILLIIPSITGSALGVAAMCHNATKRGLKTVVFNRRGHGGSVLTTAKLQSSGDPADLRQVVKYIRLKFPRSKLASVAYGTGCDLLISYLGEFGSSALISVGACVSPCYDTSERARRPMRSLYDYIFLIFQKLTLYRHAHALSDVVDVRRALQSWTFHGYESEVFCRIYGYESMEEYWERNDPIRDVDDISVPVLCINSLDDPFNAQSDIPYDLFKYYPNFLLVASDKGGHCGFLEGFPPTSWADTLCLDYIDAVFEFTTKGYAMNNRGAMRSTI